MGEKSVLQVLIEHTIKISESKGLDIATYQKQIAISIQRELDHFKRLEIYEITYYQPSRQI